jgi:hypothetical protein
MFLGGAPFLQYLYGSDTTKELYLSRIPFARVLIRTNMQMRSNHYTTHKIRMRRGQRWIIKQELFSVYTGIFAMVGATLYHNRDKIGILFGTIIGPLSASPYSTLNNLAEFRCESGATI